MARTFVNSEVHRRYPGGDPENGPAIWMAQDEYGWVEVEGHGSSLWRAKEVTFDDYPHSSAEEQMTAEIPVSPEESKQIGEQQVTPTLPAIEGILKAIITLSTNIMVQELEKYGLDGDGNCTISHTKAKQIHINTRRILEKL